jgi:hypothetical protein
MWNARSTARFYCFKTLFVLIFVVCSGAIGVSAQQTPNVAANSIPALVQFGGVLVDVNGKPLTGTVGVTFAVYKNQEGGAPLWVETQNVQLNKAGHYSVTLGATASSGLPGELFASGEARWIGVQGQGQTEQPRVMLLSVPYAMKAGDAATIGGLPPSAFVLSGPSSGVDSTSSGVSPSGSNINALSGTGKKNYLPIWTSPTALGNSVLFQSGKGSKALVGFNTTTPGSMLDVNGSGTIRGLFTLPATGTAIASSGFNSQPQDFTASVFNSSTNMAVPQTFQWQTEPIGNNTSNATGSFNLLFGQGSGNPSETGLSIASNGQISFATGQTFPGTGSGTITGVTAGTDLTGGGTGGNVTLNLDTSKIPQLASSNSFTGAAGFGAAANSNGWTPVAIGGANSFGTWITLANTSAGGHTWNILSAGSGNSEGAGNLGITDFTGTSKIFLEGNVNAASLTTTGSITGGTFSSSGGLYLSGALFATGSTALSNAFVGYSGNTSTTGSQNTGNGVAALYSNSSGGLNTADGSYALSSNTTGSYNTATGNLALGANTTGEANTADGREAIGANTTGIGNTAIGYGALYYNVTGSYNTALGAGAGPDNTSSNLTNATAVGAFSQVMESNALVLGSIKGVNGGPANALVGIGTTAPTQSLEVDSGNSLVRGVNNFQKNGDTAFLFMGDTNNFIQSTFGTGITIGVFQVPAAVRINQYSGFVGIGTPTPDNLLTVNGSADKPGGGSWGTYSDARLKHLDGNFTAGLGEIMKLHPIRYRYKDDNGMGIRDREEHIGFVAQEVQGVIPEAVTQNDKGYLLVNNDPILWTMLNAIQEQQREIGSLRARLRKQRMSSAALSISPVAINHDREILSLRAQVKSLRDKDNRLQSRLIRLENAMNNLAEKSTDVAMALPKR